MKMICGDFNSRVGTRDDCFIIHNDFDQQRDILNGYNYNEDTVFNSNDFQKNNMNVKRNNSDK